MSLELEKFISDCINPQPDEPMDLFYFLFVQQLHLTKCESCRFKFQEIWKHMEQTEPEFKAKVDSHRRLIK